MFEFFVIKEFLVDLLFFDRFFFLLIEDFIGKEEEVIFIKLFKIIVLKMFFMFVVFD